VELKDASGVEAGRAGASDTARTMGFENGEEEDGLAEERTDGPAAVKGDGANAACSGTEFCLRDWKGLV